MAVKIMVVEDEPLIRLGVVCMLEDAGFEPCEASSADDAIRKLNGHMDIRLVITDVDMPGTMDGVKLAHYIRRQWPPIQLIVISGKVGLSEVGLPAGVPFFSKPYREPQLLNVVRNMVSAGGAGLI